MITAGGFLASRKLEEALSYALEALSFEKEDLPALWNVAMSNVALGRFDEGIEAAERAVAVSQRSAFYLGILGWALGTAGKKDDARRIHEEMRAKMQGAPALAPEVWLLGAIGELDAAFEVLERAEREYHATLYYPGWPGFDPLRSDPRFAAFLSRLGLSPA
jgi:tetratricopeptide (TPR) repeat protein